MKKSFVIGLMLLTTSFAQADIKIAIVDMQKVVQSSSAGKKAKATLEEEFNKKKKELEKKEAELKKMNDDIEKKKAVMSEDALQKRHQEFQGEMMKYRELVNKSQGEIQKRQSELAAPIMEKISKVLDRMMKEKAYDLILENNPGILRSVSSMNISDEVLKEIEKEK
ncbi:hypothetical protein AZI86_01350 [Bdellovibrio bacteriovorus]|uniref:Outer membrane protein n=1 Tax=Bdellovibrio bacteriovorus TaxID=959 RepID=A0A150WMW2_BDEBC|nr:OmpH family outer membrane protein [Bdellovibrio bacteriovorus]KYG65750.1 hypothetical protein AZI86_01350 [Bdellovibrio bacteriovorus]